MTLAQATSMVKRFYSHRQTSVEALVTKLLNKQDWDHVTETTTTHPGVFAGAMLATPAPNPAAALKGMKHGAVVQPKYDGQRAQVRNNYC